MGGATSNCNPPPKSSRFQSTLPVGGATCDHKDGLIVWYISIHAPRGGSDLHSRCLSLFQKNFNPRSPWGERPQTWPRACCKLHFNPRSPWGERQRRTIDSVPAGIFQSTLPVGGATLSGARREWYGQISIHAPRGGSDRCPQAAGSPQQISIHAPRGGSDSSSGSPFGEPGNFNPRSPWGERQLSHRLVFDFEEFQSTLPVGGATADPQGGQGHHQISIHAPRGGSDWQAPARRWAFLQNFNPRSPWGERLRDGQRRRGLQAFQSTLPVGGATNPQAKRFRALRFQSTLPVGGATLPATGASGPFPYFNPRSPWGERPVLSSHVCPPLKFQSTLPVGGATQNEPQQCSGEGISIHAPRGGSDLLVLFL